MLHHTDIVSIMTIKPPSEETRQRLANRTSNSSPSVTVRYPEGSHRKKITVWDSQWRFSNQKLFGTSEIHKYPQMNGAKKKWEFPSVHFCTVRKLPPPGPLQSSFAFITWTNGSDAGNPETSNSWETYGWKKIEWFLYNVPRMKCFRSFAGCV